MENQTLGARIHSRREELGMTLQQVADLAGVTKSAMSRYERDAFQTPREVVVAAIARALHTTPEWLLGKSEQKLAAATSVDEELKFALFGGAADITDAQFEEVKRFAQFIKERDQHENT